MDGVGFLQVFLKLNRVLVGVPFVFWLIVVSTIKLGGLEDGRVIF